jgi:hypothetical protein
LPALSEVEGVCFVVQFFIPNSALRIRITG